MAESQARVLVVDDELFFREAIRDILSGEGFEVVEASDGPAAIALAADLSVGVAIVDIRLPGMDGLEVLRELRASRKALRVIMLSAHTDQELVLEALRIGACDYLAKPLHDEELVLAVRRASESFGMSEDWGRLRGRLDRLVLEIAELRRQAAECDPGKRRAVICEAATRIASDVLEAARTSVMLVDDQGGELRVAAAVGQTLDIEELDPVPLGAGVAGLACASDEALLVSDVQSDERFGDRTPSGCYQTDSFAVAPLGFGARPLGALCATERSGGGEFAEDDLGLLRLLAMQVSELLGRPAAGATGGDAAGEEDEDLPALWGAESAPVASPRPAEVAARAAAAPAVTAPGDLPDLDAEAELARVVCEAIVDEVEPDRIFEAALRPLVSALSAAPVSIFLFDAEKGLLCSEASQDGGARSDRSELETGRGLTGAVLRTGRMVAADSPEADGRFDAGVDTPADGKPGPLLCVPLALRGKVIGVFRAFPSNGASASARAGEVLGSALSAAVRNALLYRSLLDSIEEVAEVRRAARR